MANRLFIVYILFCLIIFFLCSCGSTRITCSEPKAEIYMDGSYLGDGEVIISSIGPPSTALLEAKKGGKIIGSISMKRHFTFTTILLGLCSYYTGFYWAWYYPDDVNIPLNRDYLQPSKKSPWDSPPSSVWDKPLNKGK